MIPLQTRAIPAAFGEDLTVWAIWLYYAESRTQAEVAETLGVSRASVANYLADARRRGLVSVHIEPDLLARLRLSQDLAARFGLDGVHIAPIATPGGDALSLRETLALAGAHLLAGRLDETQVLGVAWGRTMAALAEALPERDCSRMEVVQVSGSALGDAESSPEACTLMMAGRLRARCHNFHAPAVVTSVALREALLAEPTLARHFERVRNCDLVVFSVGELNSDTRWAVGDFMMRPAADAYQEGGAVGVVIGRFIDADGHEIDGPLSGRQIGMELDDLRRVPGRICVAGGAEKRAAIRATLTGGYATHLVTDAETAAYLLEGGT